MRSLLLLAAVALWTGSFEVEAQRRTRATATLAVAVADPSGAPVANVMVRLEGPAERSARTEGGKIAFEGLPPGSYRLRFEHPAYVTLERELTARAGAPQKVQVTLTPAAEPPPPPPPPVPPVPADVKPALLDLPSVIEQNYVGRDPGKMLDLACGTGGRATLIQLNQPVTEHTHEQSDEFIYVIAGDGTARTDGREERLHAGVFMLLPRGVPHAFTATGRGPLVMLSTRAGEGCTNP